MRVWGCPTEIRVYNPHERKLDPRTISGYFIGYAERSKGYRFYCPSYSTRIVELRNAKFLENDVISGSDQPLDLGLEQDHEVTPDTSLRLIISHGDRQDLGNIEQTIIEEPRFVDPVDQVTHHQPEVIEQQLHQEDNDVPLRRSTRIKKPAIPSDYVVYLQESDYDFGAADDPQMFSQAVNCSNSKLWYDAMKDEMESMAHNDVWDLVKLPKGRKPLGVNGSTKLRKTS